MRKIFYTLSLIIVLFSFHIANAKDGNSYFYKNFDVNITVEGDSSFLVEERQLYSYKGRFNMGYRNIPFKDVSDIKDVQVIDGETGKPLQYSSKALEKYNAASWGMYTAYKKNGEMIIEWYYNLEDTDHLWIIKYKVYGGIGFYQDHDEVYWNIFTNYDVPIESSIVNINLPVNNFIASDLKPVAYTTTPNNNPRNWNRESDQMFQYFSAGPFAPKEAFTITLGWQKGLLHQSDFWIYWLTNNWTLILAIIIILITIIYLFIYWLFSEKLKKGRGTIIAEYAPPHDLPPAMAEVIVMERNTLRAWAATIVDLAVRGYVEIKEDSSNELKNLFGKRNTIIVFVIIISVIIFGVIRNNDAIIVTSFVTLFFASTAIFGIRNSKDYEILRLKGFDNDPFLHEYERGFLSILFKGIESFSTARMKHASPSTKNEMFLHMLELKEKLVNEISKDEASAFDVPFLKVDKYKLIYSLPIVLVFISFFVFSLLGVYAKYIFLIMIIVWSLITIYHFVKYNPRLSKEGRILREEWLGFKLYLETAEKYRMQNLTPELFEKYLPYAMVFGVEKKWAKAFDSIVKSEPAWYGHARTLNTASSVSAGASNFSASTFSSSFSSSFSSAFSSSGAGGGGSGGGGSAGGGGGGGGGGAS
jgi:uncharacterized membrane protein YgcG